MSFTIGVSNSQPEAQGTQSRSVRQLLEIIVSSDLQIFHCCLQGLDSKPVLYFNEAIV